MKRRYSKAQLNAISRSYTDKARASARAELLEKYNIKFDEFARLFDYKGSPVRLLTDIKFKSSATLQRIALYYKEVNVNHVPLALVL